jgi:hypothetical protein
MSIEQLGDFHLVRRVLKTVAPEYRLLASSDLEAGESVLDVDRKTVEVGEATPMLEAVAAMLFNIGHLRHRDTQKFSLLFGKGVSAWQHTEDKLINALAHAGMVVDRLSAAWAEIVFCQYWNVEPTQARTMIQRYVWSQSDWKQYFSS